MIDRKIIGQESNTVKKIKNIKRIIDVILCIIIIPILVINLTMFIKKIINPNKTPSFIGYKFFVILTGSMEETLNIGDFIIIKEVKDENLKEQDIITFTLDGTEITHRISKIERKNGKIQYITKGDNNNSEDSTPVTINQIQGRYVLKIGKIGKFITFLQTRTGLIILILIPIIMGIVSSKINEYIEQKRIIRKTKRLKYDEEINENKKK